MAAPSGTTWGDIVSGYGRIGIYIGITNTNTQTKVNIQVWFWSKYSVSDSNNKYYYNNKATSATSLIGSIPINHKVDTGSGWSTSNQTKLGESTYTYDRGTSAVTYSCAAKLTGIDVASGTMTHKRSYTIPALAKYTVSYNANGGTGAPSSQTKYYGKSLTISTTKPTRTGYTFKGWALTSGGTVYYTPGSTCGKNENLTLYAVWQENALTVNYYSNYATYATVEGTAVSVSASSNVKVHSQKFYYDNACTNGLSNVQNTEYLYLSRTGYTPTGNWGTSTSGGTLVDEDTSFATGQALAEALGKTLKSGDASINLYAQWQLNTYTVSYNANGGTGAPSSQTKTHGKDLTLSTTKPTRTGYSFKGWGVSANDTTVDYSPGSSYTANNSITLYAIWEIYTYTVSYDATGGTGAPSSQKKTHGVPLTLSNTKPTRTGYRFIGWGTYYGDTVVDYSPGDILEVNASVTLYAIWGINTYQLTVNPNGGTWGGKTETTSISQYYNTTKDIPVPVWEGHTFTGWNLSGYGMLSSLEATDITYTFKEGAGTLTAKWDTNDYSVLFDAGTNEGLMPSGMESEMVSIEYGTKIGTLPKAVRKNYSFVGWFTAPSGGTRITSDYSVTGNITLYAQYEIDASSYVNDDGVWRAGVVFARDSEDNMTKGHVKINDEDVWRDAFCK